MRKQTIQKTEYILEEKDIRIVKDCLNYAFHRVTKHKKTGISGIFPPDLDYLRQQFN